jgi:DNA invertase Pin-like site-specific DNA recombinase
MTKAFSYLRVSGKGQLDGDGFERQRLGIQKFCSDNGIHIQQEFQEKAIPGKTEWDERPAWMEMVLSLNGVRTIVIESLNRLARDLMVQEHIIADLRKRGVTLISVAEPDLCIDDPTRKLLRQIMGAIAEYDKTMIVIKLRGSRQRKKAATGRCEGAKPYGFRDGESEIIQKISNMKSTGCGLREIARRLNKEGVSTRHGGPWQPRVVSRILEACA